MKKVVALFAVLFFLVPTLVAAQHQEQEQFIKFGEQIIDGQIKKPAEIYRPPVQRAKFDRLLSLKRSFIDDLKETGKDSSLK